MSEKKIDLEEILRDNCVNIGFLKTMVTPDGIKSSQGERILNAMKDLSKQLLELAAENAKTKQKFQCDEEAREQAILKAIKLVKDKQYGTKSN